MSNVARVNSEGSVLFNGARVGRVERREAVGPRGGAIVEWVAHSPFVPAAVYRTRAAAAAGVAAAWVANDRADAYPSSAEPCPCGDLFIDGVCDGCGSCSGCDVCEVAGPSVSVWEGGRFLREVVGDDAREVLRDSVQFHTPDSGSVIVGTDKHAYAAGGWQAHTETFGADECAVCGDHIEYCAGHGGDGPSDVLGMLAARYPLRAYYAREDDAVAGIESPDASEGARVRVRAVTGERLYRVRITVGGVTLAEDYADECPYSLASVILSVTGLDARER